jgi:hypothetical protein
VVLGPLPSLFSPNKFEVSVINKKTKCPQKETLSVIFSDFTFKSLFGKEIDKVLVVLEQFISVQKIESSFNRWAQAYLHYPSVVQLSSEPNGSDLFFEWLLTKKDYDIR